ncbi:PREDICTED: lymphocyte antigen 6E-like [Nanorana parkeri]|uniref:lymphocyte antigen 6E-like n=1 Tax=Nanorana parkeri TaxID=125878 RepID=UPI000854A51F|nr:PREDICTED: lymphocyte antigen 6E-like [Nanorana parkeri]
MAAYASILLLAALCIGTAYSLQCYTCSLQSSNSNCQTATNCASGEIQCETIVGSASAGGYSATVITKSCSSSCTPSTYGTSGASASTSCCSTDLCNTSGAISIKSTYSAIFLVLGTIAMLFSSSLL